jgi:hypothetical protein
VKLCDFKAVGGRWRCQNAGCDASYDLARFPAAPARDCGPIEVPAPGPGASVSIPVRRPPYLQMVHAAIAAGEATRSPAEIERVLAACRSCRCGKWSELGCREWIGCSAEKPEIFAKLVGDASWECGFWPEQGGQGVADCSSTKMLARLEAPIHK